MKRSSSTTLEIQGHCQKCEAPVFLNSTVDWYGNTVVTLNCWNGHYHWIKIEDIEELPAETRKKLITRIGFFSIP